MRADHLDAVPAPDSVPPSVFAECMAAALLAVKALLVSDNPEVVLKAAKQIFDLEKTGMRHNCEVTVGSIPATPTVAPQVETAKASVKRAEPKAIPQAAPVTAPKQTVEPKPHTVAIPTSPPRLDNPPTQPPRVVPSGNVPGVRIQDLDARKLTRFLGT